MGCCQAVTAQIEYHPNTLDDPPLPSNFVPPQKPEENIEQSPSPLNDHQHAPNFEDAERAADGLFERGEFVAAVQAYQKIIEGGYKIDFKIQGLGNADHTIGRYEWFIYRWYDQNRRQGKFRGNVYDALSLCICHIRKIHRDFLDSIIIWYENMLGERQCMELYIGYANILYNCQRYEEALRYYNKIVLTEPEMVNIHISIMWFYENRRIQKPKSIAMAKQIREKFGQQRQSTFILAKFEANLDTKIEKMKAGHEKYPEFIPFANQIGLAYLAKQQHQQAIFWFKKCLQYAPEFYAAYNNIATCFYLQKLYEQALSWCFKLCEINHSSRAAHEYAIDSFDQLNYTDEDIINKMKEYPKLKHFYFFYQLGQAMYKYNRLEEAFKWLKKAEKINDQYYELMICLGACHQKFGEYQKAEIYYRKIIQLQPNCQVAYFNMGNLQKNILKAIQWYKKAVQVNPRYSNAYINLGSSYLKQKQLEKAAECYKKAVEFHQTNTLGFINLGVCYLQMERYQDAFTAFERAKEVFPYENKSLNYRTRHYLEINLFKFEEEGQAWRKTGSIDSAQKERLQQLIKQFQNSFGRIYSGQKSAGVSDEKILKPQVLQIITLLAQNKFRIKEGDRLFQLIKRIFHEDEEYFHILPQAFIQYFWNGVFEDKLPILTVEAKLFSMIQQISAKQSSSEGEQSVQPLAFHPKLNHSRPPKESKVNLFKNTAFFKNYEALYAEITKVNTLAEQSLPEFTQFVEAVRKRSNGIIYGVNMKMPKQMDKQFKVLLRILEKMFKKEINPQRVKTIIAKIDEKLKKNSKQITLINIVREIMDVWTKEITLILNEREISKIETECGISDLIRAKLMFEKVEDLTKAVQACDLLCHLRGYEIIELDNRLSKPQTMDVVLKIRVNEAVCEFQLAIRQDESKYHLIHSIYEIERSPLGCIFGSYLFMSKGFNYPLLTNCKDIFEKLKKSNKEEDQKIAAAARYVIEALEAKKIN